MSLYTVRTDQACSVDEWLRETKERAKSHNMVKNPFLWRFKQRSRKGESIIVFDVKPLFPNFTWFGWLTGGAVFMIWGPTKWLIPCAFIGCLGWFWTAEFFFLMTKRGLRKAGYKGPIKRLKHSETIREVIL